MMSNDLGNSLIPLALGLVAYFCLHSLLASLRVKHYVATRWPGFMPAYRLAFNTLAIVLLLPLLWLMWQSPGPLLWQWHGPGLWLTNSLAAAAVAGFVWSLRAYDTTVFWGWRQWRERHRTREDPERLHISTLHRFVRHPWYFFILVLLWTRDIHLTQLLSYGLITLYLVIGSRLEETKLIAHYGEAYRRYRRQVPGLIPLPWRWLHRKEAQELLRLADTENE